MHSTGLLLAPAKNELHWQVVPVDGITQVGKGERQDPHFVDEFTKSDFRASFGELENLE